MSESETQTLTQIKALLAARGLHPKKRFGQNFLHDGNQMRRILQAAGVGVGDVVLEVGPGTGALTVRLLHAGARVVAVEIDHDLSAILREELGGRDGFTLVEADVLAGKHAVNPLVLEALGGEPFKLVANLPYNVASPLLLNLLGQCDAMTGGVVMVQREVADRMTAASGGKAYGPLSVLMQAACEVERVGTLTPGCFWPAPQVGSAVVRFTRRAEPMVEGCVAFEALGAFCQTLFQKRRKQLGSILGRDRVWPDGVTPEQRPEALGVGQIVALMRACEQR